VKAKRNYVKVGYILNRIYSKLLLYIHIVFITFYELKVKIGLSRSQ